MFLEIATTLGALLGAFLTAKVTTHAISIVFGVVLLCSAWASLRGRRSDSGPRQPDALAARLKLTGSFPGEHGPEDYAAVHVPAGFSLMFVAGTLSGLLGIGSGAVKVLAMLLIATPIARVILAAAGFLLERDWLYSVVSVLVLSILMYSLVFVR